MQGLPPETLRPAASLVSMATRLSSDSLQRQEWIARMAVSFLVCDPPGE
jgi:hypothetical protein